MPSEYIVHKEKKLHKFHYIVKPSAIYLELCYFSNSII